MRLLRLVPGKLVEVLCHLGQFSMSAGWLARSRTAASTRADLPSQAGWPLHVSQLSPAWLFTRGELRLFHPFRPRVRHPTVDGVCHSATDTITYYLCLDAARVNNIKEVHMHIE